MKARHLVIGGLWLNILAVPATAKTMVVRPDPCPIPAEAPLRGYIAAEDLNPDRMADESVFVFYALPVQGWASARILARFDIEGENELWRMRRCASGG